MAPSAPLVADDVDAVDGIFWVGVLRDVTAAALVLLYATEQVVRFGESNRVSVSVVAAVFAVLAVIAPYVGRPLGVQRHPTGLRAARIALLMPLMVLGLTGAWPGVNPSWSQGGWLAVGAAALGASSGDRVLGKGRAWWLTWAALCLALSALLAFLGLAQAMNDLSAPRVYLLLIVMDALTGVLFIAAGAGALLGSVRMWAASLVGAVLTAFVGPLTLGMGLTDLSRTTMLLGLAFASALPVLRTRRSGGTRAGDRRRALHAGVLAGVVFVFAHALTFVVADTVAGHVPDGSAFLVLTVLLIVAGGGAAVTVSGLVPRTGWVALLVWAALCLPVSAGFSVYAAPGHQLGNAIRNLGDYSWIGTSGVVLALVTLATTLVARFTPSTTGRTW